MKKNTDHLRNPSVKDVTFTSLDQEKRNPTKTQSLRLHRTQPKPDHNKKGEFVHENLYGCSIEKEHRFVRLLMNSGKKGNAYRALLSGIALCKSKVSKKGVHYSDLSSLTEKGYKSSRPESRATSLPFLANKSKASAYLLKDEARNSTRFLVSEKGAAPFKDAGDKSSFFNLTGVSGASDNPVEALLCVGGHTRSTEKKNKKTIVASPKDLVHPMTRDSSHERSGWLSPESRSIDWAVAGITASVGGSIRSGADISTAHPFFGKQSDPLFKVVAPLSDLRDWMLFKKEQPSSPASWKPKPQPNLVYTDQRTNVSRDQSQMVTFHDSDVVQPLYINRSVDLDYNSCYSRTSKEKRLQSNHICAQVVSNVEPILEIRKVRVRGSVYQVPSISHSQRRERVAVRWITAATRNKKRYQAFGHSFSKQLGYEMVACLGKQGDASKKRDQGYRTAVSNRAYTRYQWW